MGSEAHFGGGTKLTVLEPGIEVSKREEIKVEVLRPSGKERCKKKVTLVCVARDFYPDHVRIEWRVGGKERTDGVATDTSAKRNELTKKYSISSRLKVPKREWEKETNEFKCILHFYNGSQNLEIDDSVNGFAGSAYTREDYIKSSQVMKLAYGIFIGKSGLYGLIIFVFVWRKGSSGK